MGRVLPGRLAPAPPGADRIQPAEPLLDPLRACHLLCAAAATFPPQSIADPSNGASAASAKAARHEVAPTTAAKTAGTAVAVVVRIVCWNPIAAPLRSRPASSAAAANESPFQLIAIPPETTKARITAPVGRPGSAARTP